MGHRRPTRTLLATMAGQRSETADRIHGEAVADSPQIFFEEEAVAAAATPASDQRSPSAATTRPRDQIQPPGPGYPPLGRTSQLRPRGRDLLLLLPIRTPAPLFHLP
jgi:hypothetical protein